MLHLGHEHRRGGETRRRMDRREGAILKVREASHELKVILILECRRRIARARAAERAADELVGDAGCRNRFRHVKCYRGDRVRAEDARDGVDGESADGERRFVDVSERAVEPLARAHMQVRRVLEVLRDARVERAEPDARAEDPESNQAIATREECLMSRGVVRLRCRRHRTPRQRQGDDDHSIPADHANVRFSLATESAATVPAATTAALSAVERLGWSHTKTRAPRSARGANQHRYSVSNPLTVRLDAAGDLGSSPALPRGVSRGEEERAELATSSVGSLALVRATMTARLIPHNALCHLAWFGRTAASTYPFGKRSAAFEYRLVGSSL